MTETSVALVTGANKGIGKEIARGLAERGLTVLLGARDPDRGTAAARELGVTHLPLDVTDDESISVAAQRIEADFGRLDVLVNNAGITLWPRIPTEQVRREHLLRVYDTNVFGVVAVTNALLPLLRRSPAGRIVTISSSIGSLGLLTGDTVDLPPSLVYGTSKTALNAITAQYAAALADTPIKVNAACPGFIGTDLNGHTGTGTPAEGARIALRLATLPADGPTGGFFNDDGPVPW